MRRGRRVQTSSSPYARPPGDERAQEDPTGSDQLDTGYGGVPPGTSIVTASPSSQSKYQCFGEGATAEAMEAINPERR